MKFKVKTGKELEAAGFKRDFNKYYLGDKRNPDASISTCQIDAYGGKSIELFYIDGSMNFNFKGFDGSNTRMHPQFVKDAAKILKANPRPKRLMLVKEGSNRAMTAKCYSGKYFSFDCAFADIGKKDAVKIARWILAVTK